jgi:FHS family L-fucose permease-like MFS transporter
VLAFALFFIMGVAGALATTLVPAVPVVFGLGLSPALAVQWIACVGSLSSLAQAHLLERLGSRIMVLASLALIVLGCLSVCVAMVPPSGWPPSYAALIAALAVVALGIAALQVSANILAIHAGSPATAPARLTAAQAFNSSGVLSGVMLGSLVALGAGHSGTAVAVGAARAYGIAAVLALVLFVGAAFALRASKPLPRPASASIVAALRSRWAVAGAISIAMYVGAEGVIGSLLIPFLHRPDTLALSLADAGQHVAWLYWGGAFAGRIAGSWLLARVSAARALGVAAIPALAACTLAAIASGPLPGYALLSVGLCNAIMFPVIFALTIERSEAPATAVSGLLATATAGGAVLSIAAGIIGDRFGLARSLIVPAIAYGVVIGFALAVSRQSGPPPPPQESRTTSSVGNRSDLI